MFRTWPKCLGGFLIVVMFWMTATLNIYSNTEFFPVEKIKPGLIGDGYTVFEGVKIEKFKVRVLEIIESGYHHQKLILVKLFGSQLQINGGLSAGMSGSPVYIHGKLVGAISYGFENADPFLALITPIGNMNQLLTTKDQVIEYRNSVLKPIPVITPVIVSGTGQRGYELIKKSLQNYDLTTVFIPGSNVSKPNNLKAEFFPGSAISVQMVTGDYQVSALGTVTMIDNQKFLAFGHSFTNRGSVNYLAFQAYVYHTVKSSIMSFKLGAPIRLIGSVTQDRQAGIAGELGEIPDLISVNTNVKDVERKQERHSHFEVVNNEQIYRDLVVSGVTDVIDQTIDRVGGGTAVVNFIIETKDQKLTISRKNMFYGKDIAVGCLKELKQVLELLSSNEYSSAFLKSIQVDVEVCNQQNTARIVNLSSDVAKIKPGETFTVKTLIHTYRGIDVTIPFTIKLPDNLEPGKFILMIHSGVKEASNVNEDSKNNEVKTDDKNTRSLDDLITKFVNSPYNNDLVLEYHPANAAKSNELQGNSNQDDTTKMPKVRSTTDYYLLGEAQLTIEVTK